MSVLEGVMRLVESVSLLFTFITTINIMTRVCYNWLKVIGEGKRLSMVVCLTSNSNS